MKSLEELKKELATSLDQRIFELKNRNEKKGNLVLDKLQQIRVEIDLPLQDTSQDYLKYYRKIKFYIQKLDFLKNSTINCTIWEICQQHLRELETLIKQKTLDEKQAIEAAQLKQQELELLKQQKILEEAQLKAAKEEQLLKENLEKQKEGLYREKTAHISHLIVDYAKQLRREDQVPTFFKKYSLKDYKASQLENLAQSILETKANYKNLIAFAKSDQRLVKGFFQHRTLNLLNNILNDDEQNYINPPRLIR